MEILRLRTFCAVVDQKSITSAAKKLFLTQPAVSQQIRHLEEELQVELLVRGSRKVVPTLQGKILYKYAAQILRLAEQARVALRSAGETVSGVLRIGTINTVGLNLIGPILDLFLKNNPKVNLQVIYAKGSDLLESLEKGDLDIAIMPDADVEFGGAPIRTDKIEIREDEMVLVSSIKDQNTPQKISFPDLNQKRLVFLNQEYPAFENKLLRELKKNNIPFQPVFRSTNVGTLKRAIESGVGWGFLPRHAVQKQLAQGRLLEVEVDEFTYPYTLMAYLPKRDDRPQLLQVFLSAISKGEH